MRIYANNYLISGKLCSDILDSFCEITFCTRVTKNVFKQSAVAAYAKFFALEPVCCNF